MCFWNDGGGGPTRSFKSSRRRVPLFFFYKCTTLSNLSATFCYYSLYGRLDLLLLLFIASLLLFFKGGGVSCLTMTGGGGGTCFYMYCLFFIIIYWVQEILRCQPRGEWMIGAHTKFEHQGEGKQGKYGGSYLLRII